MLSRWALDEQRDITSMYEDVGIDDKNMYKVTSVLGQLKRGQITRGVAVRILTGLGFTKENAEILVDENDDQIETKEPELII